MSFSDNDNWMDELDFFPNLKPDFECSGLGLFPTDDEINMLQTSDIFGNQEQMKFDNEQEMNYVDSFFNDQSTNRTIETNTNNIDMVQPKQPPNQVIKTLLLKSTKKDLDPPLQNGLIYQNIEEQGSNKVQFQSNIITDHSFMQDNINIINTNLLNTPNNATSNNQQINVISSSNNALNTPKISIPNPTGKSNNNVIVISPTSVASQLTTGNGNNVNNNNNKKIHKIILNPNPVNLKLHNQPIVLTSPLNQYNIDWTTFDQVNQSALNNSVSVSNILNTQALTQSSLSTNKVVSNGVKVASLNNNNDNTNNDNVNVSNNNNNIHGVIINNINNINNANNLNSNNNIDNNLNKNITFNIGCSNNSNLCLGGDKEAEPIRTSHNSIEKRYRMSINNRIVELRELLAGKDSKLSKSAVLRKAIEYIRYMVAQNKQLKQENLAFRLAANSNKDFQSVLAAIQGAQLSTESIPSPSFSSPSNSPHSDDSPPSNSPTLFGPSDQAILPQRQHPGMLDRSRLILCIFMFAIFAFNPLGLIFNMLPASDTSASETPALIHSSSRMLQSEEDPLDTGKGWDGWLMPVLPWLFNLLLLVAIVMKLFVLGEPLTKPLSPSSLAYWRRRNEAEQQLFKKCYVEAGSHLGGCLVTLGRPLPTTKFDLVASLLWNLARQALHRLRVGMWLEGLSAVCCKGVSKKDVQSSAKDAAVIYHKLLQLHMTDHLNQGTYGGVNILLSTLNMAEVAGEALPKETLAEIYTLVAMDIRMALPGVFHFLARYFLTQARGICFSNCNSMPPSLTWLNHPLGHRFFVDATWIIGLDKSIFTTCINEVDPLAHMLQNFRESLLEKATLALVTPGYRRRSNQAVQCQNEWISNHSGDTLRFLGLLNEVSSGFNSMTVIGYCQLNHLSNNIGVDSLSKWWFTLLSVAVHWLNEDFMAAEALYASVESLPSALFACNSQLVRAVLLAFKARKHQLVTSAMSSQSDEDSEEREKEEEAGRCGARRSHRLLCNKASELLRDNIDTNSQQTKKMILGVQLLALDWLLVARTEAWQRESCEGSSEGEGSDENLQSGCSIHPAMPSDLCHFQTDLASLRKLSAFIKAAMPKVFAHQATARLMAGASPYRNMHLYTRSLRKRHNTKNLYLKPSRNHHHHHHNSLEELDGEKEGWKEEEWKNGKRKEAKKEEGRDLKNYILCKKVPDEEEVEQLPVPPRNTPCKRDL